jgi:hypothetical protein
VELLDKDPSATAAVIGQRLRLLGYGGAAGVRTSSGPNAVYPIATAAWLPAISGTGLIARACG